MLPDQITGIVLKWNLPGVGHIDEVQGLTKDMVEAYLKKKGWSVGIAETIDAFMEGISKGTSQSLQAILREINPRLHAWPSAEARAAHDGPWLCVCTEDGTACMGRFDGEWFKHSGNSILMERDRFAQYWPCDEYGQRVRWPEKDGVML